MSHVSEIYLRVLFDFGELTIGIPTYFSFWWLRQLQSAWGMSLSAAQHCSALLSVAQHSLFRVVLTPKISRVNQISIFTSGWVVGTIPYTQFCPIPSPHIYIFSHK